MMLRPAPASWFELLTSREELGAVLDCIATAGSVQLQAYSRSGSRLPLPDLRGTWVFTVDPVARDTYWVESQAPLTIRFETLELDPENEAPEVDLAWRGVDPSGVEAGSREYSLICRSGTPSACSLRYDGLQGLPPPSPLRQWHATLDNIAQDRIEATWGEGDHLVRVRGFRVD